MRILIKSLERNAISSYFEVLELGDSALVESVGVVRTLIAPHTQVMVLTVQVNFPELQLLQSYGPDPIE